MKNIEKLDKVLWSFLVEAFEFIDEQTAAIDYWISMTQEIYDSILDRCMELGSSADRLFYWMLVEYQDLISNYGDKIEQELNEKYSDIDF